MATINLEFDPSVSGAPSGFEAAIQTAATILDTVITNPITLTITVGWGEDNGTPIPSNAGSTGGWNLAAGGSYTYSEIEAALKAEGNSPAATTAVANLPSTVDTSSAGIFVGSAEAKALGLPVTTSDDVDGHIGFNANYDAPVVAGTYGYSYLVYLALSEIGHALGRIRGDTILSLFSYVSPGVLADFQTASSTPASYFSIDGGKTDLAPWDPTGYDTGDFAASFGSDAFGLGTGGGGLSATDLTLLNVLGYQTTSAPAFTGPTQNQFWSPGQHVSFQLPLTALYEPAGTTLTAAEGSGTALPSWLTFNPATQTFTGIVPEGFTSLAISVMATNSAGSATDMFNALAPPIVAQWLPAENWTVGETINLHIPAGTFVDPNGEPLTFSAMEYSFTTNQFSPLPSWLSFDAATQTISGEVPGNAQQNFDISIIVTDSSGGSISQAFAVTTNASPTQTAQQAITAFATGTISSQTPIYDSAATIQLDLDELQSLAAAGSLPAINLTDSGVPTIVVTAAQLMADGSVLRDIATDFVVDITPAVDSGVISGLAGHGNVVVFAGAASQYEVTPVSGGAQAASLAITNLASDAVTTAVDVTALQFSNYTEIIAQTPGAGSVTTGNIAELYGAVFGREPDIAGLAFYQGVLEANPSLSLLTYAQWFLNSPEYTNNPAHDYQASTVGDAQFITDSYQNLLGRAPEAGAIPYYENVINHFTQGLIPGTAAYATAQLLGHATVLVYFSASPEFLHDVQITAQSPISAGHWLELV